MICNPIGSPSDEEPAGTEIAGFQQRFASIVNGTLIAAFTSTPPITDGGGPSATNAGTAVVGVINTSSSEKITAMSACSCKRRRKLFASVRSGRS